MQEQGSDLRLDERSNVFLVATLCSSDRSFPVRVRNLSASGALVDGSALPNEGTAIILRRAHLEAHGQIVWRADHLRGIRFETPIDVAAWVKLRGHAGQRRVDRVVSVLRRKSVPGNPKAGRVDALNTVEAISQALDQLCERLAASPDLTDELADEVLRLDAIAQALRVRAVPRKKGI